MEVEQVKAIEIQYKGYTKVLVGMSKENTPILKLLDKDAKIIKKGEIKIK